MIYIFCLVLGFLSSAFFAGSETGFMSINMFRVKHLSHKGDQRAKFLEHCHSNRLELLTDMLIGNNLANVFSAVVLTLALSSIFSSHFLNRIFEMGYAIFLIIIAELAPKILFRKFPTTLLLFFVPGYRFFFRVLSPLVSLLKHLPGLKIIQSVHKDFFSREELISLVEKAEKTGELEEDEKEMIHGIFSFGETRAREVMTPRVDIKALDRKLTITEMFKKASKWHFSRYPIIEDDLDHIIGFVHIYDLFHAVHHNHDISKILREVYFVPETKMIDDIFKEMRKGGKTLTIVVDEYGGTSGIVTIEDIVEEVVGDIVESHDTDTPFMHRNEDGSIIVDGRADLDEVSLFAGFPLPEEDPVTETIGGFVQNLFSAIPRTGEKIQYENFSFEVILADKRKLIRLKIRDTRSEKGE